MYACTDFQRTLCCNNISKFIQYAPGSDIVQIQNSVRKVVDMKQLKGNLFFEEH